MKITLQKYAEALADSLIKEESQEAVDQKIQNFLKLLQRRKKLKMLKRFPEVFRKVWREKNGYIEVKVFLPYEKTDSETGKLNESLKEAFKKKVILDIRIDEKIIGGIKVVAGDYIVDGTVKKNLEMLRNRLISGE